MAGLIVAGLLVAGTLPSIAQKGTGRGNGKGCGGPPQTEQERAARQAACLEKNGGVCPAGGPQANCPGGGMGKGKGLGQGRGYRHGLRDGTGPRSANGSCPVNNPVPAQK